MNENQNNNHVELISEMMARYTDEWIFFEVVEDDKYEQPYKGRLLAHSPDRGNVHEIVMGTMVYHTAIWYTGRVAPEGSVMLL